MSKSGFGRLKRIKKRICRTRELARLDVFDYIESFYNRTHRTGVPGTASKVGELAIARLFRILDATIIEPRQVMRN